MRYVILFLLFVWGRRCVVATGGGRVGEGVGLLMVLERVGWSAHTGKRPIDLFFKRAQLEYDTG
jgi:hypothetical protein